MRFAKVLSAAAVACAAVAGMGASATASAAVNDDVSVLVWRVVAGPWPGDARGKIDCQSYATEYEGQTDRDTGCLYDADGNQYFAWANF